MYSNNIQALLQKKNIKHNIDKSIIENTEVKLSNLSKNIDKLKRKVLHMDLDEELSSIKSSIDNLKTSIKIVNDELKNEIKFNEHINSQVKEMILNVESHNKLTSLLTYEDLNNFSSDIIQIKKSFDKLVNKNDSPGNYFSIDLIKSISSGNYTKPTNVSFNFKVLDGTNIQDINIYKLGYYSNDNFSSQSIKLYGTMLVPEKITKKEIISYKTDIIYQLQSNTSIWKTFQDEGIWTKSSQEDKSDINNDNLLKINCLLSLANLGYIIIIPDGYSTSNTSKIFTYEGETIPSVDMIRSVRNLIITQPEKFNEFKLIDENIKVIQLGYSTGGIYGPSIINEFTSDSPHLSLGESNKFSFVAGHFGGVPSIETIIKNIFILGANKNPGYYRLPIDMLILVALYFGNCPIIEQIAQPSAYGNFFQLFKGKWFNDWGKFSKQIFINLFNNHELNVLSGVHNNKEETVEPYIKPSETMFDIRQIINIKQFIAYKEYFMSQSGWTNILRPLDNIKNIPISNLYSETDELVLLNLQEMNSGSVIIDCSQFLDKYMGKGETFFDGPNKKIIVSSESDDNDYAHEIIKQYDVSNTQDYVDIIEDIKFMNDNEYRRYILSTRNLNKELYGHNKFIFIWFDILYGILA
jgi:hypothetical protein